MKISILLLVGHTHALDHFYPPKVAQNPHIHFTTCSRNLEDTLQWLGQVCPDMVWLDFDSLSQEYIAAFAAQLSQDIPMVLFSEEPELACQKYPVAVKKIIKKPFIQRDINEMLESFLLVHSPENGIEVREKQVTFPFKHLAAPSSALCLPVSDGVLFVPVQDILFIKASGPYSEVFYALNKQVVISKTLKELASRLNFSPFDRVHNSYLVNLTYVEKIHNDGYLVLKNQAKVYVSKVHRQRVKKTLLAMHGA